MRAWLAEISKHAESVVIVRGAGPARAGEPGPGEALPGSRVGPPHGLLTQPRDPVDLSRARLDPDALRRAPPWGTGLFSVNYFDTKVFLAWSPYF